MGTLVNLLTGLLLGGIAEDLDKEAKKLHEETVWTDKDDERVAKEYKKWDDIGRKRADAIIAAREKAEIDEDDESVKSIKKEAVKAIVAMGRTKKEAIVIVNDIIDEYGELSVEELVRLSLKDSN